MLEDIPDVTQEQIDFFQENGFLQIHNFFPPEEVAQIKTAMLRGIEKQETRQFWTERASPTGDSFSWKT